RLAQQALRLVELAGPAARERGLVQVDRIRPPGTEVTPPVPARPVRTRARVVREVSRDHRLARRPLQPVGRGRDRVAEIDAPPTLGVPDGTPAAGVAPAVPRELPDEPAANLRARHAGRMIHRPPDVVHALHVMGEHAGRIESREDAVLADLTEARVD